MLLIRMHASTQLSVWALRSISFCSAAAYILEVGITKFANKVEVFLWPVGVLASVQSIVTHNNMLRLLARSLAIAIVIRNDYMIPRNHVFGITRSSAKADVSSFIKVKQLVKVPSRVCQNIWRFL